IEGVGTIATLFVHVMFIPLIPLESAFMVSDDRGVKIPMSAKSVLVAYVRSALFWTAFTSVIGVPATFGLSLCAAIPAGLAYFALPMAVRKASPERAEALKQQLGIR
ncbi:MAG: hypothetical protein ABMB14_21115, partial [Myxococcota bacterium]